MREVRVFLHAVHRHRIQAAQLLKLRIRNGIHIGDVGNVAETVSKHRHARLFVMPAVNGDDLHRRNIGQSLPAGILIPGTAHPHEFALRSIGIHPEGLVRLNNVHVPLRRTGIARLAEGVGKHLLQTLQHIRLTEDVHRLVLEKVQRAGFVQSPHVIHVIVGEQDGVHVLHSGTQQLLPEVRSGVHHYGEPSELHQHRGAKTVVPRIGRSADRTVASNHRHSRRSACSEKCKLNLHYRVFPYRFLSRAG